MTAIKPDAIDRVLPAATPWLAVVNVLFAGIAAALHVGKATIALPALQAEFGRSLEALSWVISAFPFVGCSAASLPGCWCAAGAIGACWRSGC